jgi:hypothetical protein
MSSVVFGTLNAARSEKAKRKYPHEILKTERHGDSCLYSDGTIVPAHRCTCGGTKQFIYSLRLK